MQHLNFAIALVLFLLGSQVNAKASVGDNKRAPGDPFADNSPRLNTGKESIAECEKVIKELEETIQNKINNQNDASDKLFKQFISGFANQINLNLEVSGGFNMSAIVKFSKSDMEVIKTYLSTASPTPTLRLQAKNAMINAFEENLGGIQLVRTRISWELIIAGFLILVVFVHFARRLLIFAPKELIISTVIVGALIIFMISCWSHYQMRLEEAFARYNEQQSKFTGTECDPPTTWQWFAETMFNYITISRNSPCYNVHRNMHQNVNHQIKLTRIVGEVFADWLLAPLNVLAEPIRTFCDTLFRDVPVQMIPIYMAILIFVLIITLFICVVAVLWWFGFEIQSIFFNCRRQIVPEQQNQFQILAMEDLERRLNQQTRQLENQTVMIQELQESLTEKTNQLEQLHNLAITNQPQPEIELRRRRASSSSSVRNEVWEQDI